MKLLKKVYYVCYQLFLFIRFIDTRGSLNEQDDTLSGQVSSVDIATTKNLKKLVKVGEGLLKKPVSRVNLETGIYEPSNQGTNEEALMRY